MIVKIIATFVIFFSLLNIVSSQKLTNDDIIIDWLTVTNSNDIYIDNATNMSWPTYWKSIDKGQSAEPIDVLSDGELEFKWKSDEKIGFIRHIYIYKNNMPCGGELISEPNVWNTFKLRKIIRSDNLSVKFDSGIGGGKIVFAFPPIDSAQLPSGLQKDYFEQRDNSEVLQPNLTSIYKNTTYKKEPTIKQIELKNSDDIQMEINESSRDTELILVDKEYNLSKGLIINGKNHISIFSKVMNSSEKAIIRFSANCSKEMIKIDNSNYINISNLDLRNDKGKEGIEIIKSNFSNIFGNELTFSCCGFGIILDSGSYNVIKENKIFNVSHGCIGGKMSCGIAVVGATNSYIERNSINSSNGYGLTHYYIMNGHQLNTTIIVPNLDEEYELRHGECSCKWNAGFFRGCYKVSQSRIGSETCPSHEDNRPEADVWNF